MQLTPQIREYFLEKEKVPKPQIRLLNGRYRVSLGKATDPIYYYGAFDTKAAAEAAAKKAVNERVKLFNEVREGLLNPQQAIKFLKKKGINVRPSNIARVLKTSGVETIAGKKGQQTLFKTPTDEQITQVKQNIYKDPKSKLYKSEVPKRNKLVEKYLRQGLSRTDIINRVRQESPIGVTGETIDQVAKEKNITKVSGRGEGSKVIQNIKTQLKTLDKELKDVIRTGNYTTDGLISRTRKLLNLPNTATGNANAAYRLGQLVEAYSGDTQYISRTSPYLTRQSLKITEGLPQTKGFGGIRGALRRRTLEANVTRQIGEPKTFFANVRRELQKLIPSNKINVDEVKNIASSGRYGTGPYSIFIQGVQEGINETKGKTIDQSVGIAENKLQNIDPIENAYVNPKTGKTETKKQIIDEYNKKAEFYEKQFNQNLKPGELPVRVPKLSEQSPRKTIKNQNALTDFGEMYDDVYQKFGYSFEIPKDLKTVYDARNYLRSGPGQIKLNRFIKSGAGRAFAVPLAMYGAYKGLSTPVEAAEVEPTTQQIKFDEYNTATYPSDPLVREELEKTPEEPESIAPGLTPIAASAGVAGAPEIKKAYSAARELGRGKLRSAFGLTGGLGAFAGTLGTPLFTAAMDVPYAVDRLRQGESPTEILQDPTMYLGAAFMEPLSKASGVIKPTEKLSMAQKAKRYFDLSTVAKEAKPGALSKVLRLGLNPRTIAGITRFAGIPGLLISGGLTAYDLYNTYQQSKKSQGIDE
jgi:hypothetical protein